MGTPESIGEGAVKYKIAGDSKCVELNCWQQRIQNQCDLTTVSSLLIQKNIAWTVQTSEIEIFLELKFKPFEYVSIQCKKDLGVINPDLSIVTNRLVEARMTKRTPLSNICHQVAMQQ